MEIALGRFESKRVEALLLAARAEGDNAEDLGLAACEKTRPMRAGRDADLAGDLADLGRRAAVGPALVDRDPAPDDVLLELVEGELDRGPALRQSGLDRKSTRLNSSHLTQSRMPSSA